MLKRANLKGGQRIIKSKYIFKKLKVYMYTCTFKINVYIKKIQNISK